MEEQSRPLNSTDIQNLLDSVNSQNPWHDPKNNDWFLTDGSLRDVIKAENEGLYEPPKTFYYLEKNFFLPMFSSRNNWGIFVMLGPRRIGKTSTLKYMIKKMIENGLDKDSFVYISLDQDEMLVDNVGKKRVLKEFLTEVINKYKKDSSPLIIILDEVTFYKGWARSIKNLVDTGKIGPGIGLIATGSYSLDLSSAKRELAGRYGPLGDKVNGEVYFHPKRFIEMSESILGPKFQEFVRNSFGRSVKRVGLIEYLAGFQSESDARKFQYKIMMDELMQNYYDDLHNLFENFYIKTGGYPRIIFDAVSTNRKGLTSVDDARYYQDIYVLFTTDSEKFGLSQEELKKMLSKIKFPSMQITDFTSFFNMSKDKISPYLDYLETSGFMRFLPSLSLPEDIDNKSFLVQPSKTSFKLIVNDPAAFFSIYLASRGINKGVFNSINSVIEREENVLNFLFESIVLSHLIHMPVLNPSKIGYILDKKTGKEFDGFSWYVNFKNELVLICIEITRDKDLHDIEERSKFVKDNYGVKRLIVVTNQKRFEIKENYVVIPIEIFLSLL